MEIPLRFVEAVLMPSPFPGMDPYLEDPAFWDDFHDSFIVYWRDALNGICPAHYEARVDTRTHLLDLTSGEDRTPRPDVLVHRGSDPLLGQASLSAATIEPVTLPLRYLDEERETFLEIRRRPHRVVVAVLELLSPSNKLGDGRREYLAKRQALLHQDVHLVELDLLRGGGRIPLRGSAEGDYFQYVSRGDRRPSCDVYGWTIRDPLPRLPIPLQAPDADAIMNPAGIFSTAYDLGRYRSSLRYDQAPPADWPGEEADWIDDVAKTAV